MAVQGGSNSGVGSDQANLRPQTCMRCGAKDHKTQECFFSGECSYCGARGHRESLCRKKQVEAKKGASNAPRDPVNSRQARFVFGEADQVDVVAEPRDNEHLDS